MLATENSGDLAAEYNRIIEERPDLVSESRDYLLARFRELRFVFGGRILSPYLRPHFLHRSEWRAIASACEAVWSAIEKVGRLADSDKLMIEQLGLTDIERELASMNPRYEDVSVSARLDSFLTKDSYKFVELNAECPAGIAYGDVAAETFINLPLMREFQRKREVTPMYCRHDMLDSLLKVYEKVRGRSVKPNIAIVDYSGLPTMREFELFRDYFISQGFNTVIADPRELDLREGKLCLKDFKIDLVYRRLLITEMIEQLDACRNLVEAYRTGSAVVVNSFRTKLVHKKMLFGVLTDGRHAHHFSNSEREAIEKHIPWTRRVEDVSTDHRGSRVGLLEFVRTNRDNLVLKPNDEYGGHGIFLGWETDESRWNAAIEEGLRADYLVQERVTTSRELFPYINKNDEVEMVDQLLDVDPLLFFGKTKGAFTRLSSSSLANVSSGGGMTPTMIVD